MLVKGFTQRMRSLPSVGGQRSVSVYDSRFITSNNFLLVENPPHSLPYFSFEGSNPIYISENKTLVDLRREVVKQGKANKSVEFYSHDGVRMASYTNAHDLSFLPYFKMVLDNENDFIVIGEKSFSFKND